MYVLDYRSRRLYPSVSETRLYDFTKSHLQEVRQAKQDAATLDRASYRLLCLFVLFTDLILFPLRDTLFVHVSTIYI